LVASGTAPAISTERLLDGCFYAFLLEDTRDWFARGFIVVESVLIGNGAGDDGEFLPPLCPLPSQISGNDDCLADDEPSPYRYPSIVSNTNHSIPATATRMSGNIKITKERARNADPCGICTTKPALASGSTTEESNCNWSNESSMYCTLDGVK